PHFEKMLYDNALLAWVYLEAAQTAAGASRKAAYRRVAPETPDFTLRELAGPQGGFYSTPDADSEGAAGRSYLWKPEEVVAVLGKTDAALFNRIYDITPGGNFEGRSSPNLLARSVDEWAKTLKTSSEALRKRLDAMRAKLLAARARR